jgi:hypothetical protein
VPYEETAELNSSAKESRSKSNINSVNSLINAVKPKKASLNPKKMASPPNMNEDVLNSQSPNKPVSYSEEQPREGRGAAVGGGSLYRALLETFTPKRNTRKRKANKKNHSRRA